MTASLSVYWFFEFPTELWEQHGGTSYKLRAIEHRTPGDTFAGAAHYRPYRGYVT